MITAKVRFLANNLVAELTGRADEIRCGLEETGILTPLNLIKLDNARTLQVHLIPNDEAGELVVGIVNKKCDTLGNVQRLCRHIYCLNEQNRETLLTKIKTGEINTVQKGIKFAEKLREEKSIGR